MTWCTRLCLRNCMESTMKLSQCNCVSWCCVMMLYSVRCCSTQYHDRRSVLLCRFALYYEGLYSVLIARVMSLNISMFNGILCGVQSHDVVCYDIFVAFTTIWCCMACSTCMMLSVLDDNVDFDHDSIPWYFIYVGVKRTALGTLCIEHHHVMQSTMISQLPPWHDVILYDAM